MKQNLQNPQKTITEKKPLKLYFIITIGPKGCSQSTCYSLCCHYVRLEKKGEVS